MASRDSLPEALALLEFSSIGRGTRAFDDVVKKAPVSIHTATPVSNGKYLLIFVGDVASVEESFKEGNAIGGALVTHRLLLPHVHPGVVAAMQERLAAADVEALAIVESSAMATTIGAADAAAKAANVTILEIRLGQGIGGKGFFTLTGDQADVEAAVGAAREVAERDQTLITTEIIPRPSPELTANVAGNAWEAQSLPRARKA